jgi:molybdate transport system substrate-binding protein
VSEVKVLSGGAAAAVVKDVQDQFERATGARVDGTFSAVGQMRDQLLAGAACDLVILTRPLVNQLIASGHVVEGSQRSLGLVRTGVAVRAGDPLPAISDREELAAVFCAASEIYYPDAEKATAGIHFMNVLKALALDQALKAALRPFPNGAAAMAEMARSHAARVIGCTQETEINYTPGVKLAGSLPQEFELATDYTLGVCTHARDPQLARQLAEFIAGPASGPIRRQGGFTFSAR